MALKTYTLLALGLFSCAAFASPRLPPIKPGMPGQKRGDIIAPMLDEQIAAWCDFNKQIVVTRTNILCAYVGDKTQVTAAAKGSNAIQKKLLAASKSSPKDLTPNFYEMSEYGDT